MSSVGIEFKHALALKVVRMRLLEAWKEEFERAFLARSFLRNDDVKDGAEVVGGDDGA